MGTRKFDMIEGAEHYNAFGNFKIIKYNNAKSVIIKFLDMFEHEKEVQSVQVRKGNIRNPYYKSLHGIGLEGFGKYSYYKNKEAAKAFASMFERCYSETFIMKHKSYINCTICKHWHNFQNFAEWFYSSESNYRIGYHLDKDLYIENNKEYGPLTCLYVPMLINGMFRSTYSIYNIDFGKENSLIDKIENNYMKRSDFPIKLKHSVQMVIDKRRSRM